MFLLLLLAFQIPEPPSALDQNGKRAGYLAGPEAIARAKKWEGTKAPPTRLVGPEGKPIDAKALFKKPTLLVFIEPGCPCCDAGAVYFSRIQKLYLKAANVAGVVYGPPEVASRWRKQNRPVFRVYADPDGRAARAFQAEVGLALRLIAPSGKIVVSTPGYSAGVLKQIVAQIGEVGKQRVREFVTKPATEAMASGCPLGSHADG